jgi:hypothetical protein
VTVAANEEWTPTAFSVRRGEVIRFSASGEVVWRPETGDRVTAAGAVGGRGVFDRDEGVEGLPVANAPMGALVARVDNGKPFLVGSHSSVRMPASGQLFLGINDTHVADNTGNFSVNISR